MLFEQLRLGLKITHRVSDILLDRDLRPPSERLQLAGVYRFLPEGPPTLRAKTNGKVDAHSAISRKSSSSAAPSATSTI